MMNFMYLDLNGILELLSVGNRGFSQLVMVSCFVGLDTQFLGILRGGGSPQALMFLLGKFLISVTQNSNMSNELISFFVLYSDQ